MVRFLAAAFVTTLFMAGASQPASAQSGRPGSEEACTPDVMRLCSEFVSEGDRGKITSCLRKKRRALSKECRAVFGGKSKRRGRRS